MNLENKTIEINPSEHIEVRLKKKKKTRKKNRPEPQKLIETKQNIKYMCHISPRSKGEKRRDYKK